MPVTARAAFKQADVTRALKGVEKAGYKAARIEIDQTGKIVVIPETPAANDDAPSDWD